MQDIANYVLQVWAILRMKLAHLFVVSCKIDFLKAERVGPLGYVTLGTFKVEGCSHVQYFICASIDMPFIHI